MSIVLETDEILDGLLSQVNKSNQNAFKCEVFAWLERNDSDDIQGLRKEIEDLDAKIVDLKERLECEDD